MKVLINCLLILVILIILFCLLGFWTNRQLTLEESTLTVKKLPASLEGVKLLHVSDLHEGRLRVPLAKLYALSEAAQPDLILMTGDTIDRTDQLDQSQLTTILNTLSEIAPVYVIEGNHEVTSGQYAQWRELVLQSQATLLENNIATVTVGEDQLNLIGLKNQQTALPLETSVPPAAVNLLLAHHPELVASYLANFNDTTLHGIFSGHAHGGQIRLPLMGGLFAPNQGCLPRWTSGKYRFADFPESNLFVSRGLGNSSFPFRINNRPHLISVTLTSH